MPPTLPLPPFRRCERRGDDFRVALACDSFCFFSPPSLRTTRFARRSRRAIGWDRVSSPLAARLSGARLRTGKDDALAGAIRQGGASGDRPGVFVHSAVPFRFNKPVSRTNLHRNTSARRV